MMTIARGNDPLVKAIINRACRDSMLGDVIAQVDDSNRVCGEEVIGVLGEC